MTKGRVLDLTPGLTDRGWRQGWNCLSWPIPDSGEAVAVLDLAWPDGLQEGLGPKVAFIADGDLP